MPTHHSSTVPSSLAEKGAKLPTLGPPERHFRIEMTTTKVGMTTCASIRSKAAPGERCTAKAKVGTEWCGKHQTTMHRFAPVEVGVVEHVLPSPPRLQRTDISALAAAATIRRTWSRWLARRAGPLLWAREESNNPFDFFSADPVGEIGLGDIVSFVSAGKGYIMDIKSAVSLIEHAAKAGAAPENPFTREPLSALFLKRVGLHATGKAKKKEGWVLLQPTTEAQKLALATTDVFSMIEELGYYTDPNWFVELSRRQLQQIYLELADIWFHRATLSAADRLRIVPDRSPFGVPVSTALIMQQKALRPLILATFKLLVSAAPARADKQLGVMYVLGALSVVSAGAGVAYPWLNDMFSPGVTRIVGGELIVLHPSVMAY